MPRPHQGTRRPPADGPEHHGEGEPADEDHDLVGPDEQAEREAHDDGEVAGAPADHHERDAVGGKAEADQHEGLFADVGGPEKQGGKQEDEERVAAAIGAGKVTLNAR